jgi:hypothetical protein
MAGKLVFYTPEMLQKNLQGPQFPDEISIPRSRMNLFVKKTNQYSPLLNTLNEISNRPKEFVLRSEDFMQGDKRFWAVMLDLLFPWELPRHSRPSHEPFIFTQEGYYHNPIRAITDAEIKEVFDYLNIGQARDMPQLLLKFVYDRPGAPKMPPNARKVLSPEEIRKMLLEQQRAREEAERQAAQERNFRLRLNNLNFGRPDNENLNDQVEENVYPNRNNNENYNNLNFNNENYNNNANFKNEEEAKAYGKMKLSNYIKFKPLKGGKRKTRKLKNKNKIKRKTAKAY